MFKCILVGFGSAEQKTFNAFIDERYSQVLVIESVVPSLDALSETLSKQLVDLVFFNTDVLGIEVITYLSTHNFRDYEVVFVGTSNELAIQAFKVDVLEFYAQPILFDDFDRTLRKLKHKRQLESTLRSCKHRIGLPTNKGIVIMDPHEISYCEGSSNYSVIHLKNKRSELISRTLREVENVLYRYNFYRIHKSYLVNFYEIGMLIKSEGGHVVMNDYPSVMLPVSKHVRDDLQTKLNIV